MSTIALAIASVLATSPSVLAPPSEFELLEEDAMALEERRRGHEWEAPFVLSVFGPDDARPEQELRLRVEIERRLVDDTPLTITASLPEGVTMVGGEEEERIVDSETTTIVRVFALRVGARLPEEDVTFMVSQRAEGWGAHAAKTYAFGRRVEARGSAMRKGPAVDLGGGLVIEPILVD